MRMRSRARNELGAVLSVLRALIRNILRNNGST